LDDTQPSIQHIKSTLVLGSAFQERVTLTEDQVRIFLARRRRIQDFSS